MVTTNILIDGRWVAPGMRGIGVFTLNFLIELSKNKVDNFIFSVAVKKKNIEFVRSELGETFHYVLIPDLPDPILDFIVFPYILMRNRYSLMHYTGNTGVVYKFLNLKSIVTLHDVSFLKSANLIPRSYNFKQFLGRLYRSYIINFFLESAESVVTVSNFAKNDIQFHFPNLKKLSYVYHGIRTVSFNPIADDIQKNHYLIIGGIDPQKNVKRSIDAFVKFKLNSNNDCHLKVIGVHESEYMLYNSTYQHYDFIHFLGFQKHERTLELLKSSKCLLVGSLYESFCFPIVEAMLMSVDVIASSTGATMEIGKDYINSFFNPYDVESIYSAIVHYEGTSLKKKRPIPSYLYEKFSWSNVVEHYLEEYKSLLN